jgi:hypothetical protein
MNSNITTIKVEPFERVSSRTIGSIRISIESIFLFNEVRVRITYIDTSDTFVSSELITLSGDDYNAWGNDDMYLYTYISKLKGITIKPSDQTPPAPSVDETPVEMPTIIPVEIPPLIPVEMPTIIPVEIPPLIPIEMPTLIPVGRPPTVSIRPPRGPPISKRAI